MTVIVPGFLIGAMRAMLPISMPTRFDWGITSASGCGFRSGRFEKQTRIVG
jgi:hypothetical protein